MKREPRFGPEIFISIYLFGLILLFIIVLAAPHTLVWDEPWYIDLVTIFSDSGPSLEFLDNYPGPTLPLHTIVQFAFQPLTELKAPGVRLVSFGFMCLLILVLNVTLNHWSHARPKVVALSAVSIPLFWSSSGLATTQAPAMLFFALSLATMLILIKPGFEREQWMKWVLLAASGLFLSFSAFGRQSYLSILPAIIYLYFAKVLSLGQTIFFITMALLLPFPLFLYWGGIIPLALPDWAKQVLGHSFAFSHGMLAFAYGAVVTIIISPAWFTSILNTSKARLQACIIGIIAVAINLNLEMIDYAPMRPTMNALLDARFLNLYSLLTSNLLIVLATLYIWIMAVHIYNRRHDNSYVFLSISLILLLAHTTIITHNFSSSYVAMSIPLFVLLSSWHRNWKKIEITMGCCGMLIGTLLLSYNLGVYKLFHQQ